MIPIREKLSLIWFFLFVNYMFCDIFSLFNPATLQQLLTGTLDGMKMTQGVLFGFAIVMEIGMVMVLVSRMAPRGVNRLANLVVSVLLILLQIATVLTPGLTLHYAFFSLIEVATLIWIFSIAWFWPVDASAAT